MEIEKKYIDLHVHSTASDGTYTPSEVVSYAAEKNLYAIALTDHDTIDGISEARQAALEQGDRLIVIPGIEISADFHGTDIHILGLNIDYTNKEFLRKIDECKRLRIERNKKMIQKLNALGFPITEETVSQRYGKKASITRAHFARYLLDEGYVKTKEEAFKKYLNKGAPCYIPRTQMTPEEAISVILKAGGHPVLAHPLLYKLDRDMVLKLIGYLKELGMEGIEGIYSLNSSEDDAFLLKTAKMYGLYITGGSDFHGTNKPDIDMGVGKGNLLIPKEILNNIL
ncbi:MAG: PHP domain-containing protein [Lachnospiraceae bacterium]